VIRRIVTILLPFVVNKAYHSPVDIHRTNYNETDKIIEQLGLLVMIKTILYKGAVALGTSMDFWKSLRRSKP